MQLLTREQQHSQVDYLCLADNRRISCAATSIITIGTDSWPASTVLPPLYRRHTEAQCQSPVEAHAVWHQRCKTLGSLILPATAASLCRGCTHLLQTPQCKGREGKKDFCSEVWELLNLNSVPYNAENRGICQRVLLARVPPFLEQTVKIRDIYDTYNLILEWGTLWNNENKSRYRILGLLSNMLSCIIG